MFSICVCVSEFVTHVSWSLLIVHCLALPLSHLIAAVSGLLLLLGPQFLVVTVLVALLVLVTGSFAGI